MASQREDMEEYRTDWTVWENAVAELQQMREPTEWAGWRRFRNSACSMEFMCSFWRLITRIALKMLKRVICALCTSRLKSLWERGRLRVAAGTQTHQQQQAPHEPPEGECEEGTQAGRQPSLKKDCGGGCGVGCEAREEINQDVQVNAEMPSKSKTVCWSTRRCRTCCRPCAKTEKGTGLTYLSENTIAAFWQLRKSTEWCGMECIQELCTNSELERISERKYNITRHTT